MSATTASPTRMLSTVDQLLLRSADLERYRAELAAHRAPAALAEAIAEDREQAYELAAVALEQLVLRVERDVAALQRAVVEEAERHELAVFAEQEGVELADVRVTRSSDGQCRQVTLDPSARPRPKVGDRVVGVTPHPTEIVAVQRGPTPRDFSATVEWWEPSKPPSSTVRKRTRVLSRGEIRWDRELSTWFPAD